MSELEVTGMNQSKKTVYYQKAQMGKRIDEFQLKL